MKIIEIKRRIGRKIKEIRKMQGLTQERLAEISGIGLRHLHGIETGTNTPSLESLNKIADCLKVEFWDLFDCDIKEFMPEEIKEISSDVINYFLT